MVFTNSVLRGGIVINEFLVDPNSFIDKVDTDNNGVAAETDEFIELKNLSSQPIDISGLELWDADAGNWFTIPNGSVLQPGQYAVIITGVQAGGTLPTFDGDNLVFDAGLSAGILDDIGDNIVLYDPDADRYVQLRYDSDPFDNPTNYTGFSPTATRVGLAADWGSARSGTSLVRSPDGTDVIANQNDLVFGQNASPGRPNRTFVVTTANDSGAGSLREAITLANNAGGGAIAFNIPGAGPHTIELLTDLPEITETVTIDGYTQPGSSRNTQAIGSNAVLNIILKGQGVDGGVRGLRFNRVDDTTNATGSVVEGLVFQGFTHAIEINRVFMTARGNFIGTDASGLGTTAATQNNQGIRITNASAVGQVNQIGGTTLASRNIIISNDLNLYSLSSNNLVIQGNYMGVTAGDVDIQSASGMLLINSQNATIGGSQANAGNVISGEFTAVILFDSSNAIVQGNRIQNVRRGIEIITNAANNQIGGINPGEGNTIIGNSIAGIQVDDSSTQNIIRGNSILDNTGLGIDLNADEVINPNDALDADIGANNLQNFPVLTGADGVDIAGTLNSSASGAFTIDFYANQANTAGQGELYLGSRTIATDGSGAVAFTFNSPSIFNYPFITATATDAFGNTSEFSATRRRVETVRITAIAPNADENAPTNGTYRIERDDAANGRTITIDLSGEARLGNDFILSASAGTLTVINPVQVSLDIPVGVDTVDINLQPIDDSFAEADETAVLSLAPSLDYGIDRTNSTAAVTIGFNDFGVVDTANDGQGTLRQAILNAIAAGGGTITFDIPGTGPQTITLTEALPEITVPITINGYSQTGASANTQAVGNDAGLPIVLNGNGLAVDGISLGAGSDGSTIQGLQITNFDGSGLAILSDNNAIAGNWIVGNTNGVRVDGSTGNTIGGSAVGDRNQIAGNAQAGVSVVNGATGTTILGNYIGTTPAGNLAQGNDIGIAIADSSNNVIGGNTAGSGNVVSGNTGAGITVSGASTGNQILGNAIGTDATGAGRLGNGGDGIVLDADGNTVGGIGATDGNLIAFNGEAGIQVNPGAAGNALQGNAITENADLGIDIGGDGATANDVPDVDGVQNFPVLTFAELVGGRVIVGGTMTSTPDTSFRLGLFRNVLADGEGRVPLGFVEVTTDAAGLATFTTASLAMGTLGEFVTATATNLATSETSEFSGSVEIRQPQLSLNPVAVTLTEGTGTDPLALYTVNLSQQSSQAITADFSTAGIEAIAGDDFVLNNGVLTLAPGETIATLTVTVIGDALNEAAESFQVSLDAANNAALGDRIGTGIILDDDLPPTVSIQSNTVVEDSGQMVFTIALDAESGQVVTVDYQTNPGSAIAPDDFTAIPPTTLTFRPGDLEQQVTVAVVADNLDEADTEQFTVTLSDVRNANLGDSVGVGTILDDDLLPNVAISDAVGSEFAGEAVFTVTLDAPSSKPITVGYRTVSENAIAPDDFTAIAADTLTFSPGETQQFITVAIANDSLHESDSESFRVELTSPGNVTLGDSVGIGTIIDNDVPPLIAISDATVSEAAGQAVFSVNLNTPSGQTVTVDVQTHSGSAIAPDDFIAIPTTTLTIAAGETMQLVTVDIVDDAIDEPDAESFEVQLSNGINMTITDSVGIGTILDNDLPPVLNIVDATVNEADGAAVFSLVLDEASGKTVTVDVQTRPGSAIAPDDFTALSPSTLTFAAGDTLQLLTVAVMDDALNELNEQFTVELRNALNASIGDSIATGEIQDNDAAPTVNISDAAGSEAAGVAIFTVSLDAPSGQPIRVDYRTLNGTAIAAEDFVGVAGTSLTFAPGETQQLVTIDIINDRLNEADSETFQVQLSNEQNVTLGTAIGNGTIADNDALPIIAVNNPSAPEASGEGDGVLPFSIVLSDPSGRRVTVDYQVGGGSAIAGEDYVAMPAGTLTFLPGQTAQQLDVNLINDRRNEPDETVQLTLSNGTNAILDSTVATGTILDDDDSPVLTVSNVSVSEGSPAVFSVNLSAASGRVVTVNYRTEDDSAIAPDDYTALPISTLTFVPGETQKLVTVAVADDAIDNENRAFQLRLNGATNATLETETAIAAILNNDAPPTYRVGDRSQPENAGPMIFTVSLDAASGKPVTIDYGTENGTATAPDDYSAVSGQLSFAPGETVKRVTVDVVGDDLNEADETFQLRLGNALNALPGQDVAIATIVNDDFTPSLSVDSLTLNESDRQSIFTATLSTPSGREITVNYTTADRTATAGADYRSVSGTLTVAAGETQRFITVDIIDDDVFEPTETFQLQLSAANGASLATNQATATIQDNEPAPVASVMPVAIAEGNDETTPVPLTVQLSAPSSQRITIDYATANDTAADNDYVSTSGRLLFEPGETQQIMTATVVGDRFFEPDETVIVQLTNPVGTTLNSSITTITILNDDELPRLTVTDTTVLEGGETQQNAVFRIDLDGNSEQPITADYATVDGTATGGDAVGDYDSTAGTLTFASGQTSAFVTVAINDDSTFEGLETFSLALDTIANANPMVTPGIATIIDDDGQPRVSVSNVRVTEGDRGRRMVQVPVTLNGSSNEAITVDFATSNRRAIAGQDYIARQGTVTFNPGETQTLINVPIIGDTRYEKLERFGMRISNPTGARLGDPRSVVTIRDNDPLPRVSISDRRIIEGDRGRKFARFAVTLDRPSRVLATMRYRAIAGTATAGQDFVARQGRIGFRPGQRRRVISIPIIGDTRREGNEIFRVRLFGLRNAAARKPVGVGRILNDDRPTRLTSAAGVTLVGDATADRLIGTAQNDSLLGNGGNDRLVGRDGSDRLVGGDGNDVLVGGNGNDVLIGGNGNDVLIGGNGRDILIGGPGRDVYRFTALTQGADVIRDFERGRDVIDLQALFPNTTGTQVSTFRNEIELVQSGADTSMLVAGRSQPLVILKNTQAAQINANSFLF